MCQIVNFFKLILVFFGKCLGILIRIKMHTFWWIFSSEDRLSDCILPWGSAEALLNFDYASPEPLWMWKILTLQPFSLIPQRRVPKNTMCGSHCLKSFSCLFRITSPFYNPYKNDPSIGWVVGWFNGSAYINLIFFRCVKLLFCYSFL